MQELRSQLQTEKSRGEELWEELGDTEEVLAEVRSENSELKKVCTNLRSELVEREKDLAVALAATLAENEKLAAARKLPDAADLLNQLKAKRKKSKIDLADMEALIEILEN